MSRSGAGAHGKRRWPGIASRVLAASVGGYAVAALVSSALTLALVRMGGAARADAVVWASVCSFALYTGVAIGVFAARSAGRAWAGLALAAAVAAGALLALGAWQPGP